MEKVIKDLTQQAKDFRHWEKLSLMRGANKLADDYGKDAKEYETAIKVLREAKSSHESSGLNKPDVNQQRELLLAFCDHLNTYAGMEEVRFDFMMQDFLDKSQ